MEWKLGPCYDSFALARAAPVVRTVVSAMHKLEMDPLFDDADDGGSDANWINAHGLPMVTLGTGQHGVHTTSEWIGLDEFLTACRLIERIAVE